VLRLEQALKTFPHDQRTKNPMVASVDVLTTDFSHKLGCGKESHFIACNARVRRADEWVTEWVSRHVVVACFSLSQ